MVLRVVQIGKANAIHGGFVWYDHGKFGMTTEGLFGMNRKVLDHGATHPACLCLVCSAMR